MSRKVCTLNQHMKQLSMLGVMVSDRDVQRTMLRKFFFQTFALKVVE